MTEEEIKMLRARIKELEDARGAAYGQVCEAIALFDTGTEYERIHITAILADARAALAPKEDQDG